MTWIAKNHKYTSNTHYYLGFSSIYCSKNIATPKPLSYTIQINSHHTRCKLYCIMLKSEKFYLIIKQRRDSLKSAQRHATKFGVSLQDMLLLLLNRLTFDGMRTVKILELENLLSKEYHTNIEDIIIPLLTSSQKVRISGDAIIFCSMEGEEEEEVTPDDSIILLNHPSLYGGELYGLIWSGGHILHHHHPFEITHFTNRFIQRRQNTVGKRRLVIQRCIFGIFDTLAGFLADLQASNTFGGNASAARNAGQKHEYLTKIKKSDTNPQYSDWHEIESKCSTTLTTSKTTTAITCGGDKSFFLKHHKFGINPCLSIHAEKIFLQFII